MGGTTTETDKTIKDKKYDHMKIDEEDHTLEGKNKSHTALDYDGLGGEEISDDAQEVYE